MPEYTVHLALNPSTAIDQQARKNEYYEKYQSSKEIFNSLKGVKPPQVSYKNSESIFEKESADIAPRKNINVDYQRSNLFGGYDFPTSRYVSYKNKSDPFSGDGFLQTAGKRPCPEYQYLYNARNSLAEPVHRKHIPAYSVEPHRPEMRHYKNQESGYEIVAPAGHRPQHKLMQYSTEEIYYPRPRTFYKPSDIYRSDGDIPYRPVDKNYVPKCCTDFGDDLTYQGRRGISNKANISSKENILGDGQYPKYMCDQPVSIDNRKPAFDNQAAEAESMKSAQLASTYKNKFGHDHWNQ